MEGDGRRRKGMEGDGSRWKQMEADGSFTWTAHEGRFGDARLKDQRRRDAVPRGAVEGHVLA